MRLIFITLLAWLGQSGGYNILAVFPLPSKSHDHLGQGIVKALLKAGHEVTWATPYPEKKAQENLTIIDVSETRKLVEKLDPEQLGFQKISETERSINHLAARSEGLQRAMMEQFDAVITPVFFSGLQSGYAAVQQAPWIVLGTMVLHSGMEMLVGDVTSTALVPNMLSDYPVPMNLWQRLSNTYMTSFMAGIRLWGTLTHEKYYQEIFGPMAAARGITLPPYSQAASNISVLFVNSHPSLVPGISVPPNVVDIAGYHIADHHSPLPKDLQDIMDSSNGVVYFSLGSIVKATAIPAQLRADLIRIFSALPYTVLWKFEEPIEGLPKNIHVRSWMPQPAILAHPKIKLFMTHGGLLSTLEAVQAGVPLLAIPVFGDQPGNARRAECAGYALSVPFSPDMGNDLEKALDRILKDNSYSKTAKSLSRIFNNRPVPPAKLIAHYVELAIETKGAYHLRSPTYQYRWYERYMLDQLAVLVLAGYVVVQLVKRLLKMAVTAVVGKKIKKN